MKCGSTMLGTLLLFCRRKNGILSCSDIVSTCTGRGCGTTAEQGGHEGISARSQDAAMTECAYQVLHVNANRPRQRKAHLVSSAAHRATAFPTVIQFPQIGRGGPPRFVSLILMRTLGPR